MSARPCGLLATTVDASESKSPPSFAAVSLLSVAGRIGCAGLEGVGISRVSVVMPGMGLDIVILMWVFEGRQVYFMISP